MAAYRYIILNAKNGEPLAEVPFTGVSFTDVLSGIGGFEGQLPLDHPKATRAILGGRHQGDREITVLRSYNGRFEAADTRPVWHGPIIKRRASLAEGVVQVSGATPFWYLTKRTLESNRRFNRDLAQIVRSLFLHAVQKPNGALYRYSISDTTLGVVRQISYSGIRRLNIGKLIMDLSAEDDGFEFRDDITDFSNNYMTVSRTLRVALNIGVQREGRVLEIGAGLRDLIVEEDMERAANRSHVLGSGNAANQKVATAENTASFSKFVLHERVRELTTINNQAVLNSVARYTVARLKPPVVIYSAVYRPTPALPFDFCFPGDSVHLRSPYGYFDDDAWRRVIAIVTTVDDNGQEEEVRLDLEVPEDSVQ